MDAAYGSLPPTAQKTPQRPTKRATDLDIAVARICVEDPATTPERLAWAKGVMGAK